MFRQHKLLPFCLPCRQFVSSAFAVPGQRQCKTSFFCATWEKHRQLTTHAENVILFWLRAQSMTPHPQRSAVLAPSLFVEPCFVVVAMLMPRREHPKRRCIIRRMSWRIHRVQTLHFEQWVCLRPLWPTLSSYSLSGRTGKLCDTRKICVCPW